MSCASARRGRRQERVGRRRDALQCHAARCAACGRARSRASTSSAGRARLDDLERVARRHDERVGALRAPDRGAVRVHQHAASPLAIARPQPALALRLGAVEHERERGQRRRQERRGQRAAVPSPPSAPPGASRRARRRRASRAPRGRASRAPRAPSSPRDPRRPRRRRGCARARSESARRASGAPRRAAARAPRRSGSAVFIASSAGRARARPRMLRRISLVPPAIVIANEFMYVRCHSAFVERVRIADPEAAASPSSSQAKSASACVCSELVSFCISGSASGRSDDEPRRRATRCAFARSAVSSIQNCASRSRTTGSSSTADRARERRHARDSARPLPTRSRPPSPRPRRARTAAWPSRSPSPGPRGRAARRRECARGRPDHLVEAALAGHLHQRLHLDAGDLHRRQEVRDARVLHGAARRCARAGYTSRRSGRASSRPCGRRSARRRRRAPRACAATPGRCPRPAR